MRSRFVLLLLVGAAVSGLASHENAWKVGQEYQYLVRSRTLTSLDTLSDQYTGIIMKAILKIQSNSPDTLRAKLMMPQYAQIHKELPEGWETDISDQMLEYNDLPMSPEPFVIMVKHGVVRDLIVNKNVPTWEVNIIKSIVSQLQADTQGENARRTRDIQIPQDKNPFAMFHVMEDSVGGKCEVLYDITPLPEYVLQDHPELVPKPELKGNGEHMYIMKTKNYDNCEQRVDYHFGISGNLKWNNHRRSNRNFMTKSSTSNIVISGDLKTFAIQSSVTRNQIVMKPRLMDEQDSIVMNKMNLTLASIGKVSTPIPAPNNPESTGNLVYTYNNPFSATQHRRLRRPSVSPNSMSVEFDDGAVGMDSYQDSGDALTSDEGTMLWQSKPRLQEAPENPLLPLFIGNKGKAVVMSDRIDAIKNVKKLVQEISNEIEEPNTMPEQETLEKFTILSRLISSMSFEQIQKAEGGLHSFWNEIDSDERNQLTKENARSVFRDAVADAGTGPALMIIKKWIENREIEGMEAADVVSRLPKTARMPTAEYMDTLFSLATNPEVQKQEFLNSSAILAFADLVYLAQVSNSSIHNNYPVHSFGRPLSRHNDAVLRKYIPFMTEQLKRAIKDGDSPRIQAYILALGSTGHPKILSVFEPYLEGKEQVSTFQRLLMVACLGKLAENKPTLTRSVLYKIYLNTWEAHQVRCAAVFMLMKMKLPLDMLLRMAKFTNYDYNVHVNSAVKSAIESAAQSNTCEWQEYAKQAKDLLNPWHYGYFYSQSSVTDAKLTSKDLAYRIIFDYIGSDDSIIPSSLYLSLQSTYGNFVAPAEEVGFMVSSMKNLLELYQQKQMEKEDTRETLVEKIAKMLSIESEYPEQVEGNYFINSRYQNHFFAFDNHTLERIPKVFMNRLKSMKAGSRTNLNRLMSYDINLSYPTETGLPFVYSLRIPILHKMSVKAKDMDMEFRLTMASKVQGRVGFVTPFDQQSFVSGIDMKTQLFVPGRVGVKLNPSKSGMEVEIKLQASKQAENIRMLHFSVVPYTSRHNVLSLRPLLLEKNTQIIQKEDRTPIRIPSKSESDCFFVLEVDAEDLMEDISWWSRDDDMLDLMFPMSLGRGVYEKIDLHWRLDGSEDKAITLKAVFETMDVRSDNPSESNDEAWMVGSKAPMVPSTISDSRTRRSNFLREVAKGMNSANAYVLDASLELPGKLRSRHVLTISVAESDAEQKYRSLVYWHMDAPELDMTYEICGNSQMRRKATSPFDFEKILSSDPREEVMMHIRHGEKCSEGSEITIKGKMMQSEDYKEYVKKTDIAKKCKKRMENGMKSLEDCEKAIDLANTLNEVNVTVFFDSNEIISIADKGIDTLARQLSTLTNKIIISRRDLDADTGVTFYFKLSPDLKNMNGKISTPDKNLNFYDLDLEKLGVENDDITDLQNDMLDTTATCTIDTNEAMTFDGKTYPLKLGKCSHVLTTTYPKRDPKNHNKIWRIPEDMKVSVIARETEDDKKEVTIVLGEDKIMMRPSGSKLRVTVNGEDVELSQTRTYQRVKNDETVFAIYELPDPAIKLSSDEYEINVMYDGERVQVELPTDYQKSVRGLCGDFDGQPENDFVTPKNCILKKPEEFAATYAMRDKCEGMALKNAKMAERSMCTKKTVRLSDVISDEEAGRPVTNWKQWGYHTKSVSKRCNSYRTKVIQKNDQICFTLRPVPTCSEGCAPVEMKQKKYQLHCMPKNEASIGMKNRVEQGANPDLSQRTPSATEMISIPLECAAA
ncbi:hypothetical protein KPH14_009697 [Odynerus spinipes]|uniref:Vitellogenin n=1 Tax=Odynerus spinipes TaxID=1348599 RepID=A0AAD9RQ19_9HYME|nr:hypothetical protein KPH14_009697 [Odynerus spinipes]